MAFRTIDGPAAWRNLKAAPHLRWAADPTAFDEAAYPVRHEATFKLAADDRIFCIGSCFARNIEEHLAYRGLSVLSQRIVSPAAEAPARPTGMVNKFTTFSMANELEWAASGLEPDETFFARDADGGWYDMQLASGAPVTAERAVERRRYLTGDYFARLRSADVVIVTLGLIETWRDRTSGLSLNMAPPRQAVARDPDRYVLEVTDVAANLEALETLGDRILTLNPAARIVVSVSPVPLDVSFTGQDPVVANMLSKSVLRCCAEAFARRPNVDYFPSFEMASLAPRRLAFAADCRHVRDAVVSEIIDRFLTAYDAPATAAPQGFTEMGYLAANPDVESDVRGGRWDSGFHQFQAKGRAEGRKLTPDGGPTRLMIKAGAV